MDNECIEFIIKHKWEIVKTCPLCHEGCKLYHFNDKVKCAKCRKIFSVRKNTIFESSKVPLFKWFKAISYVTENEENYNSVKLSKHIEVTQKTAYYMLGKMRKSGVIKSSPSKQIEKQNDEEIKMHIRNTILKSRISIPGTKKKRKSKIDMPLTRKEFYSYLKDKLEEGNKVKKSKRVNRAKKSPYEKALLLALN